MSDAYTRPITELVEDPGRRAGARSEAAPTLSWADSDGRAACVES